MFTRQLLRISLLVASLSTAASQCQLCPNGSSLIGTNVPIPPSLFTLSNPVTTCADLETELVNLPANTTCSRVLDSFLSQVDFRYYCQCSGVPNPGLCGFGCNVTNGGFPIRGPLAPFNCSDLSIFAEAVVNPSSCGELNTFNNYCCLPPSVNGSNSYPAPSNGTYPPYPGTAAPENTNSSSGSGSTSGSATKAPTTPIGSGNSTGGSSTPKTSSATPFVTLMVSSLVALAGVAYVW